MSPLEIAGMTLFILSLFLGIFSTVFGFPGRSSSVRCHDLCPVHRFRQNRLQDHLGAYHSGNAGEAIDFGLSMAGAQDLELRKRGLGIDFRGHDWAAIMSPFFYGLGMLSGVFLGGFVGIIIVETLRQGGFKPALRASYGSMMGRVAAMLAKGFISLVMIIIVLINVYSLVAGKGGSVLQRTKYSPTRLLCIKYKRISK